ncbi:MAG: dihydrodipicolinate synthase family protein [Gemmatimonadales bacterium]
MAKLTHRLIPAVPVPFDRDGELDDVACQLYARWMAVQDIGGVAVWAHTGRGLMLSEEQRRQVLAIWRAETRELPLICGVGAPAGVKLPSDPAGRTDRVARLAAEMAASARTGGADALLVYPPAVLRGLADLESRIVEVHRAVADVGLPLLAFYLYERVEDREDAHVGGTGGMEYSPRTIELLLSLDAVVGIKLATLDSVVTFQDVVSLVRQCSGSLLITGEDRFFGYSLMMGADGALVGIGAACTDASAGLLRSWYSGDLGAFHELSARVDAFAARTFCRPVDGYVQRMLWALEADGVLEYETWDPFGPKLDASDRDRVVRAVRDLRGK